MLVAGIVVGGASVWFLSPPIGEPVAVLSPEASPSTSSVATPLPAKPVVIFKPGGRFSEAVTSQLMAQVAEPMIDYYQDNEQPVAAVVFEISQNGEYSYLGVRSDGTYEEGILPYVGGVFDVWAPPIM